MTQTRWGTPPLWYGHSVLPGIWLQESAMVSWPEGGEESVTGSGHGEIMRVPELVFV